MFKDIFCDILLFELKIIKEIFILLTHLLVVTRLVFLFLFPPCPGIE